MSTAPAVAPAKSRAAELDRSLRARHVTMIAIGGIIGAGLFVGSSTSIRAVGPAVIVSYLIAGTLILLVMRMLSELAMRFPGTGSLTELIRAGLGDVAGFVSGWLYLYFWIVVVAVEAIAGAVIVAGWVPAPVWLIGVVLLTIMTGVNLLAAHVFGEFEFWLSSLKVAAIIVFILLGAACVIGVLPGGHGGVAALTGYGGFAPHGWSAVIAGVTSVIFALTGAEIATIAAAESEEPAATIARLTASVAARILLFYVCSITLIVCILPWNEVIAGQSPFAAALTRMGIPGAGTVMRCVVLVAVLSCLNSGMYVTGRVLFQLARRGDAPAALVRLSARRVPLRSTLITSLFGYGALFASVISPQLVFSFLVNASGATMLEIYLLVCLAQIAARRRAEVRSDPPPPIRMWLFPYLSYAAAAAIGLVLAAMLREPGLRSQLVASLVLTALVLGAGLVRRRRQLSTA